MVNVPYDKRDGFIWMDGKMRPWNEAQVHYLTHALHYATSVFEGERAYNGKIFKSREHSERLIKSAKVIYMDVPYSANDLEDIKQEVLKANNLDNAYIRAAAWRGPEQMGIDVTGTETHVAVAAWEWGDYYGAEALEKGAALITSQYRKPAPDAAPVHSKCAGLYVLSTMAKLEAKKQGCADAVMYDFEGYVAEATSANLFFVKDGVLITPIADRFLNGLTRQTIIALAKERNIEVIEKRVPPEELHAADEVFLTGSAAEVTAIGKLDDIEFTVGPITRTLRQAYSDLVRA